MISVVIPTCDRVEMLKDAIECVASQSISPLEVIIVNNGMQKLVLADLPEEFKIVDIMPRAGVSQARNFGAFLSKGEYIAFLDDDDLWEVNYLEKVNREIKRNRPDCIVTRIDQLCEGEISPLKNPRELLTLDILIQRNPGFGGSNIIVNRKAFLAVGGFDAGLITGEDISLAIEFLLNGYNFTVLDDVQAIARQHSGERLTDPQVMIEGSRRLFEKYRNNMSLSLKLYKYCKMYRRRYKNRKDPLAFLGYTIYGVLFSLVSLYNKRGYIP